jgi:hypothetical protein
VALNTINEFLGNISHFSELSATCQTIPDLKECNYINEIGFTRTSIVDFDLKSEMQKVSCIHGRVVIVWYLDLQLPM